MVSQGAGNNPLSATRNAGEYFNLGNKQLGLGALGAAVESFRRALKFKPDFAEAHYNLGVALQGLGQFDAAAESYRRTLNIQPDLLQAHINLGSTCMALGRLDEAVACLTRVLEIKPDFAGAHYNLGMVLQALGRPDEAVASLRQALKLNPVYPEAHVNLGVILQEFGQLEEAEVCFHRALEIRPDYAEAHNNLGALQLHREQLDQAESSLRRAIALKPDYAEAYTNLGGLLMVQGEIDDAEQTLGKAIELDPGNASLLSKALFYFRYKQDDPRFSRFGAIYARRESLPLGERIKLNFAMGKAMEDVGQYDESFCAYEEGNRLHYAQRPFDEAGADQNLEATCSFFNSALFEAFAAGASSLPSVPDERIPVFIVGMPRSGSTLIEQVLASHPAIFGAGELSALDSVVREAESLLRAAPEPTASLTALRELGQEYLERIWALSPGSRLITNKMPGNYHYLGLIYLMLPNAKIIHPMRNPMDVSFSCFTQNFFAGHEYTYDLKAMGRQYLRYVELMRHWHGVLPAGWILDSRYEDMVAEPERETRHMLDFLGLPWNAACLNFHEHKRAVHTASIAQVRKPIYSGSVARWKRYEDHLAPLLEILRPVMPEE
jgi:Tfp pilus assembly protein PilF